MRKVLFIVAFLCLTWVVPAQAITCTATISPGTNLIAAAFNVRSPGDTLCLAVGSYPATATQFLTASGTAGNPITLTCADGVAADCTLSATTNTSGLDPLLIGANYVTVENLTITGGDWGLLVTGSKTLHYHHVTVSNVVASNAACAGISMVGGDYFNMNHCILFNNGKTATQSCSGATVYEPQATDTISGTHIYFGYNIAYLNGNPSGGTDGEGFSFDDFSCGQGNYCTTSPNQYTQQAVAEENISFLNQGPGFTVGYDNAGANITVRDSAYWWNNTKLLNSGITTRGEMTAVQVTTGVKMYNSNEWANQTQYTSDISSPFVCSGCTAGYVHSNNLASLTTSGGTTSNPLYTTAPTCTSTSCSNTGNWNIASASPARGIGTTSYGLPPSDFAGNAFNAPPDSGAYQFVGATPAPTPIPAGISGGPNSNWW